MIHRVAVLEMSMDWHTSERLRLGEIQSSQGLPPVNLECFSSASFPIVGLDSGKVSAVWVHSKLLYMLWALLPQPVIVSGSLKWAKFIWSFPPSNWTIKELLSAPGDIRLPC